MDELVPILSETLMIVAIVAALMVVIEFLEIRLKDKFRRLITDKPVNQYIIASLLGAIPGCVDAFFIVSLYTHGIVGFGALVSVMLSTAGDEAFVMLAMIPEATLLIIVICIVLGIIGGFLADKTAKMIKLKTSQPCPIEIHEKEFRTSHFIKEHVYGHVFKKHIPRIFLWVFFTLLAVEYLMAAFDFESLIAATPRFALIMLAALIGIIPESGPHIFFVVLFSKGLVPFSVLLVNTLSQDGHGLLPLLSYSIRDTVYVQIFTTVFSVIVGIFLYAAGL